MNIQWKVRCTNESLFQREKNFIIFSRKTSPTRSAVRLPPVSKEKGACEIISVVVPVFNEEDSVVATLQEIESVLSGFSDYEIIVVDDGSRDATLERARNSSVKNLRIISHIENLGYGAALFHGIEQARNECIAIIDGDGSYPPTAIIELYKHYPAYDMIVGARQGREYLRGFLKRPARILFAHLVEYAVGHKVPDVNSGLRILKRTSVLQFSTSLCAGFSFTTTLTLLFFLNHYFVKYVPVEYKKRHGKSKVNHFRDSLRAGQIIIEAILLYNPIKLFLLLAAFDAAIGLGVGILNEIWFHSLSLAIASGIALASFLPIFALGLIGNLIKHSVLENRRQGKFMGL